MRKALKIAGIVLLCSLLIVSFGAWFLFDTQLKAAESVMKLEDGLYAMEYAGDYGFEAFLAQGGASDADELANFLVSFLSHDFYRQESSLQTGDFGCSTLTVTSPGGGTLMGRNYDWDRCNAMLVHTIPEEGYESVSTTCLDFLGFGPEWRPDQDMISRMMALAAVYLPLDGINEKGLCVADLMAGDNAVTQQNTDKIDLTTTSALRLLLDRAATVDEAVELLKQYDMHSDIGRAHHYALADATGNAVTVEYIDGEMVVTETKILTNHYLAEAKRGIGSPGSQERFAALSALATNGTITREALGHAMEAVIDDTQWTCVFDTEAGEADFFFRSQFEKAYRLTLGEENWLTGRE